MITKKHKPQQDTKPEGTLITQTVAMYRNTNFNGDIFGGWIMSQMDIAAGITAAKRSAKRAATVAVDELVFLKPVKVGDTVSCYSKLLKVGKTSMSIHIETWVTPRLSDEAYKVTEGTFVFVAIDEHGRPIPVDG